MSYIHSIGNKCLSENELKEFLGPDTSIIVQHDTLNTMFWDESQKLRKEVRARLLEIANNFLKGVPIGDEKHPILDITFTGSNANYNYTTTSDVDVHILMDLSRLKTINPVAAKTLYNRARAEYNKARNITVRGFKVEVFVEDADTPPPGGGIYSLVRNRWIKPPERLSNDPKDEKFKSKTRKFARRWAKMLKAAISSQDVDFMFDTFAEIKKQRGIGIEREGDGSPENAAFKVLRANRNWFDSLMGNTGLMDKFWNEIDRLKDERLSMPLPEEPLKEFFFPPNVTYHTKLHPDIFGEDDLLKPEVREQMQKIASAFRNFIGLKRVLDVRFKGSMANYNYTKSSDIDLHLIANCTEKQLEYFEAKRVEWKEKYKDISIFGHPVELGVELPNKIHSSSAVYSVSKNEWIDKPLYKKPETNIRRADIIYKQWKKRLQKAIRGGDLKEIRTVEKEIRAERNKALPGSANAADRRAMEISDENVAYKRLRDTGIFEKIKALYIEDRVQQLSLEKEKSLLSILGF